MAHSCRICHHLLVPIVRATPESAPRLDALCSEATVLLWRQWILYWRWPLRKQHTCSSMGHLTTFLPRPHTPQLNMRGPFASDVIYWKSYPGGPYISISKFEDSNFIDTTLLAVSTTHLRPFSLDNDLPTFDQALATRPGVSTTASDRKHNHTSLTWFRDPGAIL